MQLLMNTHTHKCCNFFTLPTHVRHSAATAAAELRLLTHALGRHMAYMANVAKPAMADSTVKTAT